MFVRTGCFTATYDKCVTTYAQKKLLKPNDLGYVVIQVKFERKYEKEIYKRRRDEGCSRQTASESAMQKLSHKFSVIT